MLVCVCVEVETAISTVIKLLNMVSSVFSQHSKYVRNVVIASVAHALVIGSFLITSLVVRICHDIKEHCMNKYFNAPV